MSSNNFVNCNLTLYSFLIFVFFYLLIVGSQWRKGLWLRHQWMNACFFSWHAMCWGHNLSPKVSYEDFERVQKIYLFFVPFSSFSWIVLPLKFHQITVVLYLPLTVHNPPNPTAEDLRYPTLESNGSTSQSSKGSQKRL